MQRCILVDIDGTVADRGDRHIHDYDTVHLDGPQQDVIDIAIALSVLAPLIFITGRPERCRDATLIWLESYGLKPRALYMRQDGDYRKDFIVKKEIYDAHIKDRYDVWFALDDRDQIVSMWREAGIRCLQVRDGNY